MGRGRNLKSPVGKLVRAHTPRKVKTEDNMSLGLSNRKTAVSCIVILVVMFQASLALGAGTLRGKVFDKTTKDELPGANVVIKGTGVGASTDLSGAFIVRNAPSGEQTVVVSYLGYVPVTATVNIPEGETVNQDFFLVATSIVGQEIVITAQAQGQLQAINQQLSSDKIVSVVSEAKIQELPDFNAAQAIARLPGVSTLQSSGEANKVVIRGLAPQYSQVSVSGISMASTGSTSIGATSLGLTSGVINQDRSVDISSVSAYMIKSISVYKTLTPDMNADAIGGVVNMELRDAPSGFHSDLLWQSGYTNKTRQYGNYRTVLSASDRFLDDLLGVYVLGNLEQYDRASDNMSASYLPAQNIVRPDGFKAVTVQAVTLARHIETRKRYGGNAILDFRLPSGSIRSVNLLSRLEAKAEDYQTILHYGDASGGNVDFTYRNGKTATDLAVNTLEFENDFGFMSANLKVANTYSRNHLPLSPYYQFRQTGGINTGGQSLNDVPPDALPQKITYKGAGQTYLNNINLFSADFKENDQVYKADFKVPLPLESGLTGNVKVGGEFRYNYRTNEQATPYLELRRGGTSGISVAVMDSIRAHFPIYYDTSASRFPATDFNSTDPDLLASFLNDRFGGILWAASPSMIDAILNYTRADPQFSAAETDATNPGGWYDGAYQHLPNNYKYVEKYYAGYAMTELSLGPDLKVVGGVRFEQVKSLFDTYNLTDGRNPLTQNVYPVTVYPQNHYWLPMVQGKYNLTDWLDIRYAYTQTLARPDYHQLSPHITMSNDKLNVWAGNPRLQPAHAYNHDLQFTLHDDAIGLISVGGFYKTVSQFTYYTTYKLHPSFVAPTTYYIIPPGLDSLGAYKIGGTGPNNGANLNTYINSPYDAYVKGLEADVQMRFWYLPEPLNGLLMGVNYTHIWSKATYPWRDDFSITDRVTRITTAWTVDSTRTGRLLFQPNDVVNAYIGYDYSGFSARVSFLFQGNSVNSIGNFAEQDGFAKDYFRIDASARQLLPLEGLQLFLDVNNINARKNQAAQASIGAFTNEQNYGLTANLGVRFTY
jgi:TonB-dependent receptor